MSFWGLVDAHVIGGGGASRDARKEVPMRVSMGRLQGLRLGMSHQNDAAQKVAAASADLGWSEERRLAQKPGSKGAREAAGLRPPRALKLQHSARGGPRRSRQHLGALRYMACRGDDRSRWWCGCGRGTAPVAR